MKFAVDCFPSLMFEFGGGKMFKSIIQWLFIALYIVYDNIKKVLNTFKLLYIVITHKYQKASYTVNNNKLNFIFYI